jgi:hypothetical protein
MLKTKVRGIKYRGKSRKFLSDYVEEDKKLFFRTASDKYRYFYTGQSDAQAYLQKMNDYNIYGAYFVYKICIIWYWKWDCCFRYDRITIQRCIWEKIRAFDKLIKNFCTLPREWMWEHSDTFGKDQPINWSQISRGFNLAGKRLYRQQHVWSPCEYSSKL